MPSSTFGQAIRRGIGRSVLIVGFASVWLPEGAHAQRVDENATAQAEDAFGINISGQNLGLYDPNGVRGFSPTAAGNVRLDGLYIDTQANFTSRLIGGYRILVGPSVLGHPFPAPSGIADYNLRRPGKRDLVSISTQADSFGGALVEVDGQVHDVLPHLGFTGGVGFYHYGYGRGGRNDTVSSAITGVWRPRPAIEIIPFFSRIANTNGLAEPTVLLAGSDLPPAPTSSRFVGQRWAASRDTGLNYGALGRVDLGAWRLRTAVFRSQDRAPIGFTQLFVNTRPSGDADRLVIAERDGSAGATSGEVQISRTLSEGPRLHRIYLAAWGRDQRRRYGATDTVAYPGGRIDTPEFHILRAFSFGPQTDDRVRQATFGAAYEGSWKGVGVLNLGIQKTDYHKDVTTPAGALPTSRARPWLFNIAGAIELSKRVTAYAGISRGLEESDIAPDIAVNRNQAPPAIRTRQIDAGLRWSVAQHLSLVADIFQIEKPYYGLDAVRIFRNLGEIRHDGIELSLAGAPLPGLSVVAGAVGLDATVSGDEVAAGVVGSRPVGSSPLRVIASFDYKLPGLPALSFDANVDGVGQRVATVENTLRLPARALIGLGLRYRLKLSGKPAVFRLQATNVTDTFSWGIVGSGALQPGTPRQLSARLTVDI
ncbi:hypothetical protein SPAN111604_13325 [Sphingomonas antarctica]|uniref:TonB-dependent receptor n=1 Tax=Sphingomonas antarctica TaxID=2040274 RepID=UPI0039E929E8